MNRCLAPLLYCALAAPLAARAADAPAAPDAPAARFQTDDRLRQFLRDALRASPEPRGAQMQPVPQPLLDVVAANQPASGDLLLSLSSEPDAAMHRSAVNLFVAAWGSMSAEQISAYLRSSIVFSPSVRARYPRGLRVAPQFVYEVRHAAGGFPGAEFPVQTHVTLLIDGKKPGASGATNGTSAALSTRIDALSTGLHTASLHLQFSFEHRGATRQADLDSPLWAFEITEGNVGEMLESASSPQDEAEVRAALRVTPIPERDNGEGVTWGESASNFRMRFPNWRLEHALPFALAFDVEIYVAGSDKPISGGSITIPAGHTSNSFFAPLMQREFAHGRTGLVPIRIVLVPSAANALSEPGIEKFFSGKLSFDGLAIDVIRPRQDAPAVVP